ncbi:alpha/beta hydrolase-fold protein [Bacteroides sp.]
MKFHLLVITMALCCAVMSAQSKYEGKYPYDPAMHSNEGVIPGEVMEFRFADSKIYPGTERKYWIYVPAAYKADQPACLYVCMDDILFKATTVFDNLISTGEMPVTIGVFVGPGEVKKDGKTLRHNRSYEFDTTNDSFVRFLLEELLPDAETKKTADGRPVLLSKNPNDRAIAGASSGGICAFTAAWERPDAFRRVFSAIGTFVGMRGGNEYPVLIRKTEPKPLRVFLEDGTEDAWNPLFGHWFDGNLLMESALSFSGYEVAHSWGHGGHDGVHAERIFPDVMRWLWKGWPREIECGTSQNDMLREIIDRQPGWEGAELPGKVSGNLFSNDKGEIIFQTVDKKIYKLNQEGAEVVSASPGGSLVGVLHDGLLLLDASGRLLDEKHKLLVSGMAGVESVLPVDDTTLYAVQRANGKNVLLKVDLKKKRKEKMDEDETGGSYLAIYPDHSRLVQEKLNSQWLYTYILPEDASFSDKQHYYRLHNAGDSFAFERGNMIFDSIGYLYVATPLGVQVCDREGLVRAILPIPNEKIVSLSIGGKEMDSLYALTEDGHLYVRKLNVKGTHTWNVDHP